MKILMFPNKKFPCDHAMLENVYAKKLLGSHYEIHWLMPGCSNFDSWHKTKLFLFPLSKFKIINSLIFYLYIPVKMFLLTSRNRYEVIQVRNSIFAGFIAKILVSLGFAKKFIFQLSFPHAEASIKAASLGFYKLPYWHISISKLKIFLRHLVLTSADYILAISERMKLDLINEGLGSKKIFVFPLGGESGYLKNKYTPPDKSNQKVIYYGSLNRIRDLNFLIKVFSQVKNKIPKAKMIVLGGSPREDDILKLKKQAKESELLKNIEFVSRVPREKVLSILGKSQVSLCPYYKDYPYISASPTKLFESLAAGIPVVGTDIPEIKTVLSQSEAGYCVAYDESLFAEAIIKIISSPTLATRMSKKGKEYIKNNRTYEILAKKIDAKYKEWLKN